MTDTGLIVRSLELAAEKCADLTSLVYRRLFEERPDLEPLFVMDRDHAVRGSMLAWTLTVILDVVDDDNFGGNMIAAEAGTHAGYGVPPETFTVFFGVVARTLKDLLGDDWTPQTAVAWKALLRRLEARIVS